MNNIKKFLTREVPHNHGCLRVEGHWYDFDNDLYDILMTRTTRDRLVIRALKLYPVFPRTMLNDIPKHKLAAMVAAAGWSASTDLRPEGVTIG